MEFRDLKRQYQVLKPWIDRAVVSVMESSHFIGGSAVSALEARLAEYAGVKHCISCANGTDAITIALRAFGVGPGDAVFIPDFTFFSTGECPADLGAEVIFVDVCKDTYNLDPAALEAQVARVKEEGRLTPKAVIAVDLFGLPADYERIRAICDAYGLFLLEDAAQGFGGAVSVADGRASGGGVDEDGAFCVPEGSTVRKACSFGDISTTSFFPAKPLGCYGDGGAIFTDNDDWAMLIRSIAVHGKDTENLDDPNAKYNNIRLGYNSRLDTIQAAILDVKLSAFEGEGDMISSRPGMTHKGELCAVNRVAKWYDEYLKPLTEKGIKLPVIPDGYYSSWAQYTVQLPVHKAGTGAGVAGISDLEKASMLRADIQKALKSEGIPSMIYYPKPMHSQGAFAGQTDIEKYDAFCPNTVELCSSVLSLPMHPYMSEEDVKFVVEAISDKI